MGTTKIKLCPFCGSEAKLIESYKWKRTNNLVSKKKYYYYVKCSNRETRVGKEDGCGAEMCDFRGTEEEVIEKWNTRVENDQEGILGQDVP